MASYISDYAGLFTGHKNSYVVHVPPFTKNGNKVTLKQPAGHSPPAVFLKTWGFLLMYVKLFNNFNGFGRDSEICCEYTLLCKLPQL